MDKFFKKHLAEIERILVDEGVDPERAKEMAFHVSEIIPDFEIFTKKLNAGLLKYKDLRRLAIHVPYHAASFREKWDEQLKNWLKTEERPLGK